ncbi:unnamed protein product [Effrenium voratum]|nr:unnamed protein product [Effrenium voratum]
MVLAMSRRSALRYLPREELARQASKGPEAEVAPKPAVAAEVQAERQGAEELTGSPKGLVLQSFSVGYGDATALEPISLAATGVLGVLGVSGSGKSALLAALAGALPRSGRTSGKALLEGRELQKLQMGPGQIGYCPQENELTPGLTVTEQLLLFGRLRGVSGQKLLTEVRWLTSTLDLEAFEESQSENLSGGNQRKLQCGCALMGSPRLVILDEPSAGLDPMARRCLANAVRAKKVTSTTVIATKSIDEAEALCSKLIFLTKDGALRTIGSSLEIRQRYGGGHELRATLLRPSMQEVYESVQGNEDRLRGFLCSCLRAMGKEKEIVLPQTLQQLPKKIEELLGPLAQANDTEAPEGEVLLSEDSEEMKSELAARSQRIFQELKQLYPKIQVVEEVSLLRVFQLHDDKRRDGPTWGVAEVFRQVEDRKVRLKIADYSVTQASLEHVFNELARADH